MTIKRKRPLLHGEFSKRIIEMRDFFYKLLGYEGKYNTIADEVVYYYTKETKAEARKNIEQAADILGLKWYYGKKFNNNIIYKINL